MTEREAFCDLVLRTVQREALRKLIFSKPTRDSMPQRISARLCARRGRRVLAMEYTLAGNTVLQKNVHEEKIADELSPLLDAYGQINLLTAVGDVEYRVSRGGKELFLGRDALEKKLRGELPSFVSAVEALDRKKKYLLDGHEPFLFTLGISDKSGRVHDKMQGKFRQIHRFLEHLSDVYDKLPSEGVLHIYDLCCGKSYLSFAVYHYLTAICGRELDMLCMDLKADVIRYCADCASALGYSGMHFVTGDITELSTTETPDLVMSLHACDVATDIVLDTAIRLGARIILSTPCCHRYLTDKLHIQELSFVTSYPHLKNKLAEVLTDGIRTARLRAHGYRVSVSELTDPENTPKNTLLRAIKIGQKNPSLMAEYRAILSFVLGDGADTYLSEFSKNPKDNV